MKDNGDGNVIDMTRPKSSILESIKGTVETAPLPENPLAPDTDAVSPAGEKIIPLPLPGDPYDRAYARPENNPMPMLRCMVGDSIRGFSYPNLDIIDWLPAEQPGGSPSILIWFTGIVPMEVIISGRHLLMLYDLLSYHRIAWIRELPKSRDFKGCGATVITAIAINKIKRHPD